MLKLLPPNQYQQIYPLFQPLSFNLVVDSVIAGNTPARVYVERTVNPRLSLLWDLQDALLLAGDLQDLAAMAALRNLLHNHILPDARARGIPEMALYTTRGWLAMVPSLLSGLAYYSAERYSYRLAPDSKTAASSLECPPGFRLIGIDEDLLASGRKSLEHVRGWIDSFWHTPQDFLRTGFGYCVVREDAPQVVSWCLTVFADDKERELGVATLPDFRDRGLATLAVAASVTRARSNDLMLHWHCWADNLSSAAIANRLGFQLERSYHALRLQVGAGV